MFTSHFNSFVSVAAWISTMHCCCCCCCCHVRCTWFEYGGELCLGHSLLELLFMASVCGSTGHRSDFAQYLLDLHRSFSSYSRHCVNSDCNLFLDLNAHKRDQYLELITAMKFTTCRTCKVKCWKNRGMIICLQMYSSQSVQFILNNLTSSPSHFTMNSKWHFFFSNSFGAFFFLPIGSHMLHGEWWSCTFLMILFEFGQTSWKGYQLTAIYILLRETVNVLPNVRIESN